MRLSKILAALLLPAAVTADPVRQSLPFPLPARPFLLLDAPRRYLPTEPAVVRVQRSESGPVQLALFRIRTIAAFVVAPWPAQGVSVAARPLGRETEALLARTDPFPRQGADADLLAVHSLTLRSRPPVRRALGDETGAYDSHESDEGLVETVGVDAGAWAEQRVSLGALPAGVYLVRASAGGWSASAVLSVGTLTVLARRGDAGDVVTVTDGEGAPQAGVAVQRFVAGSPGPRAITDAAGRVELPRADALTARFVAVRGTDVAWADVTHAGLPACDVRVYLATGRPAFRPEETVHLRGHARGCDDGADAPLAEEPVELRSGDSAEIVRVRTDRDGNFTAELPARAELTARVRGRDHRRTIHLDGRPLPRRALALRLGRPWAAAGETVTATLSDADGGWPHPTMATFRSPAGVFSAPIGPGRPATLTFTLPPTTEALARFTVRAELPDGAAVTYAEAELWTGATRDVIELASDRTQAAAGDSLPLRVSARDLGGEARGGEALVRVFASDGNRPVGPARAALTVTLPHAAPLALPGAGPWWVEAVAAGELRARPASLVVWERDRPPTLSPRGELALAAPAGVVQAGEPLALALRTPAAGRTLVTLEQGGVWSSRIVAPGEGSALTLPVPAGAAGAATVVATHVHGGQVHQATAAVEVETARRFGLTVATSRRAYPAGATARVIVRARTNTGAPRDAVVSLWVADAGWWSLAPDDHPSPDAWFRLPGRPASAGDSTRPLAFGAEEGRRFATALTWNDVPLFTTGFRRAWLSAAPLVNFASDGSFAAAANVLARAAGLARAEVCPSANASAGPVRVRAQRFPWDLAAYHFGLRAGTGAHLAGDVLRFDCGVGLGSPGFGPPGGLGHGSGSGSGSGSSSPRTETLDGTIFFLGLRRLGPTGEAEVDLPLPPRAGRWRVEATAIADDGAGTSGHADFVSTRPVVARVELPGSLAAGDVAAGAVIVEAAGLAGRSVTVAAEASEGLRTISFGHQTITLDARGMGRAPITVEAVSVGRSSVTARVSSDGTETEQVSLPVTVRGDGTREPVDLDTAVGPGETEVELRVPALREPAILRVDLDDGVAAGVAGVVESLRAPSWQAAPILLERLRAWASLRDAVTAPGVVRDEALRAAVIHGHAGAAAAVVERLREGGGLSWWHGLRSDVALTAIACDLLHDALPDDVRRELLRALVTAAPTVSRPAVLTQLAAALAHDPAHRATALSLLDRALAGDAGDDGLVAWERGLSAATALGDDSRSAAAALRLSAAVDRTLAREASAPCRGAAWFVCLRGDGDRARLARAARALVLYDVAQQPRAARALAWIARHPLRRDGPAWGRDEAAVVALQGVLPQRALDAPVVLRLDGQEIGRVTRGGDGTPVRVEREGLLTVLFPRLDGRAARLRVRGELPVAAIDTARGTLPFGRRIEVAGASAALVLDFTLPSAARDVTLEAPLPARWLPAGRMDPNDVTATGGSRPDRWGFDLSSWDWYGLDRTPTNQPPRVDFAEGVVRVRFAALRPGSHTVRLPLTAVAEGSFRAGGASLRADGGRLWAITPPLAP